MGIRDFECSIGNADTNEVRAQGCKKAWILLWKGIAVDGVVLRCAESGERGDRSAP